MKATRRKLLIFGILLCSTNSFGQTKNTYKMDFKDEEVLLTITNTFERKLVNTMREKFVGNQSGKKIVSRRRTVKRF